MKIKRISLKKEKPVITCEYCESFQPPKRVDEKGLRICHRGYRAAENQAACDSFELYPYFWCRRNGQRYDLSICKARRERSKEGCVSCSQGKLICNYLNSVIIKEA